MLANHSDAKKVILLAQPQTAVKKTGLLDRLLSGESIHYRQIVSLFLPILVDQAFLISLGLINTAMISSSGVAAVSAVNMTDSLHFLLVGMFISLSAGGTVVVAQYKGSGNEAMVSRAAASTVSTVPLVALCISLLIIFFHNPVLKLLYGAASPDVLDIARTYLVGGSASFVGIALVDAVCGVMRGIGRTRVSLALSLLMNGLYVILNFVLLHLFHMGVNGLVIALNVSRYLAAACAIVILFRTSLRVSLRDLFRLNLEMLKKIVYVGVPLALEQIFFNGGKMITQLFIVSMGTYALAVNAIGSSLAAASQIIGSALSLTLVTVVGQSIGRRNIDDARKFTKSFIGLSSLSFVLTGLIIAGGFRPIVGLFHPPEEIVGDIFTVTLVNLIFQIPLWSISFVMPAALRAAGDSKFTSITALLSMWLVRIVLGYLFGITLGMGVLGVWLAMNLEWGVRGSIFVWRFLGKKWYQHRLVD